MKMSRFALFAGLATLAACGPSGTFVVLDFTSGPAATSAVHCSFTLAGTSATADFAAKAGSTLSFPTKGSVEIGKGAGTLAITCEARDASAAVLASVTGSAEVVRDKTTTVQLMFGTDMPPGDGGIKPTGALTIAPIAHNFGVTLVGSMSPPQTFTVTNTGDVETGTLQFLLLSDLGMDFATMGGTCAGKTLVAKDTCTVTAQFTPKSAGTAKHALLQVSAPDGTAGGTATASLDGSAGAKGDLHFDKDTTNFAGQLVGSTTPTTTLTLTNTGTGPTTMIDVTLSGSNASSFAKSADMCSGSLLQAGATCTVQVSFSPGQRGDLSATLSATATKGGTAVSNLSGKGQLAATLTIMGGAPASAPASLGTVDVGNTGTIAHHFTVKNDGDFAAGPLNILTIPNNADVMPTALTTCMNGMVLNPGDTCVGDLVLKPTVFGVRNAQVNVSATPGGNVTTNMSGIGQDFVTIQVAVAGAGGSNGVVSDTAQPHNFNCGGGGTVCSKTFARNQNVPMVAMLAMPDGATQSAMDKWTTAGINAPPCQEGNPDTTTTCSLNLGMGVPANTPATPYTYTALFKKQLFTVTYQRVDFDYIPATFGGDGAGLGALTSSNGFNCAKGPCITTTELVPAGTALTVAAKSRGVAGQGKTLRRITAPACTSGTNFSGDSTDATCTFTVTADTTVKASFSAHNYAFVTSTNFDGNLGGLAGANAKCQAAATAAHIPGGFIAVLSDSATNMRDRLNAISNGWIRVDGSPFSQDKTSLFGQGVGGAAINNFRIYYPLNLDENGMFYQNSQYARTYSNADGSKKGTTDHCANWTSNNDGATASQSAGTITAGSAAWIDSTGLGSVCNFQARLYCLGTDNNTPVLNIPLPVGVGFKRIFMSNAHFTPGATLARSDMDTICKSEGQVAYPASTFKSLVATTTTTAASQAPPGAYALLRPDNVNVGLSTTVFGNVAPIAAPITQFANGSYPAGVDGQGWIGAVAPNVNGSVADTCNNWTDPSGMNARIGFTFESASAWWNWVAGQPCNGSRRFYCIEQ